MLLAGCLALSACAARDTSPREPDLLLIVSDTLRGDAIRCDDDAIATPNLCALAARGVQFERAYSHAPGTLRSSVAMFTGNHTPTYSHFDRPLQEGYSAIYVPHQEQLLPECLQERGYDTSAFVQNPLVATSNALQGFRILGRDYIEAVDVEALQRRLGIDLSEPSSRAAVGPASYLLEAPERFYLIQWMLDPHAVYSPPVDLVREIEVDRGQLARAPGYYTRLGHFDRPKRRLYKLEDELPSLSDPERDFVRRLYEKEVEWMDERVGFILEALERSGRADNTIVAFTSDHGEAFGEHDRYLHGSTLYDEMVRVPLILAGPGIAPGRRVSQAVSTVDLTPTLADLAGGDCLETTWGTSLRPYLEAELSEDEATGSPATPEPRPIYLANPGRQPADALVLGSHKLISDTERRVLELYDLDVDPEERTNLAVERQDLLRRLHSQLVEIRQADRERRKRVRLMTADGDLEQAEEAIVRELEAIGYLD